MDEQVSVLAQVPLNVEHSAALALLGCVRFRWLTVDFLLDVVKPDYAFVCCEPRPSEQGATDAPQKKADSKSAAADASVGASLCSRESESKLVPRASSDVKVSADDDKVSACCRIASGVEPSAHIRAGNCVCLCEVRVQLDKWITRTTEWHALSQSRRSISVLYGDDVKGKVTSRALLHCSDFCFLHSNPNSISFDAEIV